MSHQTDLKRVISIAKETGVLLREGFKSDFGITYKNSEIDLVTDYDRRAEALIFQRINENYPEHAIVGEESGEIGNSASAYRWYVDPIDGTTNFAHGIPSYSISIALYVNKTPLIGVVYDPSRDECFAAARGMGTQLITADQTPQPLRCSSTETIRQSVIATGFPYDRHSSNWDNLEQLGRMAKRCQGIRRSGSAALDLAYVAAGRFDAYWEYKLNMWDLAAGVLLVLEAGGRVSNLVDGSPFKPEHLNHIVASNHNSHQALCDLLVGPVAA
ncbi:MAG: inositol monophosphatase family protein [Chloroflexota bacterium]